MEKLNADYEKSLQLDGPGLINSLRESADAFRISASERSAKKQGRTLTNSESNHIKDDYINKLMKERETVALLAAPLSCNLLPCYKPNPEHKNLKLLDVT
nr:DUF3811 domain-containing protein [Pectobacterium brasiliense]